MFIFQGFPVIRILTKYQIDLGELSTTLPRRLKDFFPRKRFGARAVKYMLFRETFSLMGSFMTTVSVLEVDYPSVLIY